MAGHLGREAMPLRPPTARTRKSSMHWSSSRTRPVRACMWVIRAPTPRWTSLRARSACRAITCCIRWAGTLSACPPRTSPSRTTSIRQMVTKKNIARFKSQLKSLGLSFDWIAGDQHHRPELLQVDPVDLPAAVQAGPGLQEGNDRKLVHLLQVRAGQRRGRRRRLRALRRRGGPQGQEPVDARASPSTPSA